MANPLRMGAGVVNMNGGVILMDEEADADRTTAAPFAYEVSVDEQKVRLEAPTLEGLLELMKSQGVEWHR